MLPCYPGDAPLQIFPPYQGQREQEVHAQCIYVLEHEQYNCTDRMQLDCLPPRDAALAENAAGPSTAPGRERIEPKNTRKPKKEKTWRDLGSEACRTTGAKLLGL